MRILLTFLNTDRHTSACLVFSNKEGNCIPILQQPMLAINPAENVCMMVVTYVLSCAICTMLLDER